MEARVITITGECVEGCGTSWGVAGCRVMPRGIVGSHVPKSSRRRGDGGTGVDAGAEGHQSPRDTAFIDADALPMSEMFASSFMQRSRVPTEQSKPGPPEVKVEV